jgi:hypothetical protein
MEHTGGNKSKQIRDMLHNDQFSSKWMVPSMVAKSPLPWLILVDGFIVDARSLPRALQEEAYEMGLIPYIPADLESDSDRV